MRKRPAYMPKLEKLIRQVQVEFKTFGEVAAIIRGGSPRPISQFLTQDKDGVNWIKIGDTKVGDKYIHKTKEKIIKKGVPHYGLCRVF